MTDIVRAFTENLLAAIELATVERSRELATSIISRISGAAGDSFDSDVQADEAQRQLVTKLAQEFQHALEIPLQWRMRELLAEHISLGSEVEHKPSATPNAEFSHDTAVTPRAHRQVRRRTPRVHLPPPPDPEQLKRDAEVARLRALLRPASEEAPAPAPAPAPVVAPPPPARPTSPGDILRALEKEIQDAVPSLGALAPDRCGAQIAAWTGSVRELRDQLPPEVSATMRPAFRIFLEHLTQLRDAMEAHVVDALEPSWNTPDWGAYVEVNRACAEERAPDLSAERLVGHHRTMLRALLKPHRRNVPAQAIPIINAAAKVLPAGDAQLRSAMRRHASAYAKPAETQTKSSPAETADKPAPVVEERSQAPAEASNEVLVPTAEAAQPAAGEFDLAWTQ